MTPQQMATALIERFTERPQSWRKGISGNVEACACVCQAAGALVHLMMGDINGQARDDYDAFNREFAKAAGIPRRQREFAFDIFDWNDDPNTTLPMVLAALKKVAQL